MMITKFNLYTENVNNFENFDLLVRTTNFKYVIEVTLVINKNNFLTLKLGHYDLFSKNFILYPFEKPRQENRNFLKEIDDSNVFFTLIETIKNSDYFLEHVNKYLQNNEDWFELMIQKYEKKFKLNDFNL